VVCFFDSDHAELDCVYENACSIEQSDLSLAGQLFPDRIFSFHPTQWANFGTCAKVRQAASPMPNIWMSSA